MGRIKTKQIKSIGKKLYGLHRDDFKLDFGHNKTMVNKYVEVKSKRLRNSLAGYMTRLIKRDLQEENSSKTITASADFIKHEI